MKAVWVTRSFLDYRIPVYRGLSELLGGQLSQVYNREAVPSRVRGKAEAALGENAIGLEGEHYFGPKVVTHFAANSTLRIPWQPGLVRRIRENQPDVVISDGFFQWTAAALWLRARYHIPHVMCYERTAHTERNAQWFRLFYRKWAIRYVDAMCCNGRLCGEYSIQLGMPRDRMTFGHMVADSDGLARDMANLDRNRVAELRKSFGGGLVILYVGRLSTRKGLPELLHAWSLLDPVVREKESLVLVGEGPDRDCIQAVAEAKALNNIHFVGAIDYDHLAAYYACADAFIIPTLEDNWSLVVPEAMACGLPILCSKYNGCWPELAQEGRNGWVFDPLSAEDICRAVKLAFANRGRLKQMGEESRKIVQAFTPKTAAAAIFRTCEIALARNRSRRAS